MPDTHTREETLTIAAPKFAVAEFPVIGTAPLVMAAFSEKARAKMRVKHEAGSTAKTKKERDARDFAADCEAALHRMENGEIGFPASAWRGMARRGTAGKARRGEAGQAINHQPEVTT